MSRAKPQKRSFDMEKRRQEPIGISNGNTMAVTQPKGFRRKKSKTQRNKKYNKHYI